VHALKSQDALYHTSHLQRIHQLAFLIIISHHQALQPLHPRDDDVEEGVEGGGGEADEGLRQGEQEAVDAHDEQQLQKDIECAAVDDLPEADDVNMGELLRRNSVPKKLQGQEQQQQQQPDVISKKSKHIGFSLAAPANHPPSSSSLPQRHRAASAAIPAPNAGRTHNAKQIRIKQQAAPFLMQQSKRVLGLNVEAERPMLLSQEVVREIRAGVRQVVEYNTHEYTCVCKYVYNMYFEWICISRVIVNSRAFWISVRTILVLML
jgi:hypothetical protein